MRQIQLIKPMDPDALYATLLQWLSKPATVEPSHAPGTSMPAPMGTGTQDLAKWLARIPGLDVELGLKRVRGSVAGYRRMLAGFVADHAQEADQLKDALPGGDLMTLKEVAHSLKGSGGNIGAMKVAELATELYAALRWGDQANAVSGPCQNLIAALTPLLKGLRRGIEEGIGRP